MNPSSQPYQPGELPPVPPAFPGDAAAASLTAEQVQALRNRNYLRADSYTRADSYGRQDSGLSFYEYQIGDGDESPVVLPCSGAHEICRTCVAALRKADGTIQCPKCREDATGAVNPNRGLIAALRLSRRS